MAESEQTQVIQPKKKMGFGKKLIIILAVIVAFLGVCSLMIVHQNNQLEKKFYQVKSNKVVDNIRIVALADLHLKEFGKDNEKLVAEVKNLSPDIVAIVGDMNLESQPDNYSSVISLCKQLNEIAPVYYVLVITKLTQCFSKIPIYIRILRRKVLRYSIMKPKLSISAELLLT